MAFDLQKALVLPDSVWGYFEWFTGIIRLNIGKDLATQKRKLSASDRRVLNETYYHEFFHCCQICTTGYLYYYINQIMPEVIPFWRRLSVPMLEPRAVTQIIEEAVKEKRELSNRMKILLSNLDKEGIRHTVTARTIIESQCFLVQKQMTNPALSHQKFIRLLKQVRVDEYSAAYLLVTRYLGSRAFDYFHAIAYAALLFLEPQDVFEEICLRLSAIKCVHEDFLNELHVIIDELKVPYFYLGDSEAVRENYFLGGQENPFYKTSIELLRLIGKKQEMNFFLLMCHPEKWFDEMVVEFDVPIIFNNGIVYGNNIQDEWELLGVKISRDLHLILGCICLIICNQKQGFAPRYLYMSGKK